jgi:hypothetical protein
VPESAGTDELYGIDPSEFTARRNALVKELKADGRPEEAAQVARLRRPPLTAWALNVVARDQTDLIDAVLQAGRELRDAMGQTLRGDRSGLSAAQAQERTAIEAAVDAAAQHLALANHPASDEAKRRMTETLRSATADEAVADLVARGTLDADKESVGFDVFAAPSDEKRPTDSYRSTKKPQQRSSADKRRAALRRRLEAEREELREKARRAHSAADKAHAQAAHLADLAEAAETRLAEAQQRLEELEDASE